MKKLFLLIILLVFLPTVYAGYCDNFDNTKGFCYDFTTGLLNNTVWNITNSTGLVQINSSGLFIGGNEQVRTIQVYQSKNLTIREGGLTYGSGINDNFPKIGNYKNYNGGAGGCYVLYNVPSRVDLGCDADDGGTVINSITTYIIGDEYNNTLHFDSNTTRNVQYIRNNILIGTVQTKNILWSQPINLQRENNDVNNQYNILWIKVYYGDEPLLTSIIVKNDLYIQPINPTTNDNLNCSFNLSYNDEMNVTVTWFNSTDNINWVRNDTFDYIYYNATNNSLVTTQVTNGTIQNTELFNYTYWKCGLIVNNNTFFNSSAVYILPVDIPFFGNISDNSNLIYPQIENILTVRAEVNASSINIDMCKLSLNDTKLWKNSSNITINNKNVKIYLNYTIQNYSTANQSSISYKLWCNNSFGQENESSIYNFTIKDLVLPSIILNVNNSFSNGSVISSYLYNLTLDMNFFDYNLFQANINITCDINNSLFYWEITDINESTYVYSNVLDIKNNRPQKCNYYIQSSDDHTTKTIPDYKDKKINSGIEFIDKSNQVIIISLDEDYSNVNTVKQKDRYNFDFSYDNKQYERNFKITSNNKLYYRSGSNYPAHFVAWDDNTKTGNWVDFKLNDNIQHEYIVTKVNEYEYNIKIVNIVDDRKLSPKYHWFGKKYSNEELEQDTFGIDNIQFNSIGGTNVYNLTGEFYLGSTIYVDTSNRYDNSTLNAFNVTLTKDTSQKFVFNTKNGYITNITNGTYNILFVSGNYFPQYNITTLTNNYYVINYSTFQSVLNLYLRSLKIGELLSNANISIYKTGKTQNWTETQTNLTTIYLNATTYNLIASKNGYAQRNSSVSMNYMDNITLTLDMYYLANFFLFDEKTLGQFNTNSPDTINFLMYCPNGTYSVAITNNISSVPITCDYTKFKFLLAWNTTSYYRSFILEPDATMNLSIYLVDLATTTAIYTPFRIDDLLNQYNNPRIYISKLIGGNNVQITADYTDAENKIGSYLIQNDEYVLNLYSDNKPVKSLGTYFANTPEEKVIKLYAINLDTSTLGYWGNVNWYVGLDNSSGSDIAYLKYTDKESKTNSVTWSLYSGNTNGTLIYNITTTDKNFELTYNVTDYMGDNVVSKITVDHPDLSIHDFITYIYSYVGIAGSKMRELMNFVDPRIIYWMVMFVISILALYSTIESANIISLVICGFAMITIYFGWFRISWGVIAISVLVSLLSLLKKGANTTP